METTIGDGPKTWALLRCGPVHGRGRIAPYLAFAIYLRTPRERMSCQVQIMRADLLSGGDTLGTGLLTGVEIVHGEYSSSMEIPLSPMALDHLGAVATGDQIDLVLRLSGWLRVRDDNEEAGGFVSAHQPGVWSYVAFGRGRQTDLAFRIARSDWYTQVLQPIGTINYVSTEIALPAGDARLAQAVRHLTEAERAARPR